MKTLQLANKKSVKTIRMNPKLDTNPYNFALLAPFLRVTNFHYVVAILIEVSANQRTRNTPRDHQFPIQSFYNPWYFFFSVLIFSRKLRQRSSNVRASTFWATIGQLKSPEVKRAREVSSEFVKFKTSSMQFFFMFLYFFMFNK